MKQDYFDAIDFISGYSSRAALRWEAKMLEAFDHLADWPQTGRLGLEYGPDHIRFWIAEEYLILYDPLSDPINIIGIVHGAQDLAPLVAKRLTEYDPRVEDETEDA